LQSGRSICISKKQQERNLSASRAKNSSGSLIP